MPLFYVLGCLRHLTGTTTLRAQVQDLYHFVGADKAPLARSTWSDALNSPQRQDVLERVLPKLYHLAQAQLADRLADIPGLGARSVYAVDGTSRKVATFNAAHRNRVAQTIPRGIAFCPISMSG